MNDPQDTTEMPQHVAEAIERRWAAIGAENKRRMEAARRTPPIPLQICDCGRPAVLVADSFRPGRYLIYCEAYWDAMGWSCPDGRSTDSYADPREAAEEWNSGLSNTIALA